MTLSGPFHECSDSRQKGAWMAHTASVQMLQQHDVTVQMTKAPVLEPYCILETDMKEPQDMNMLAKARGFVCFGMCGLTCQALVLEALGNVWQIGALVKHLSPEALTAKRRQSAVLPIPRSSRFEAERTTPAVLKRSTSVRLVWIWS